MRLIGTTVRRFVASLMLLAALAFAFHGATHAGALHLNERDSCHAIAGQAPGGHHHAHAHGTHDHADHGDQEPADHHHGKDGQEAPCCGNICATAMPAMHGLEFTGLTHRLTGVALPDTHAVGFDPAGLGRPPKPLTFA